MCRQTRIALRSFDEMAKVPSGIRRETVAKAAIFPETFASYAGRRGRFRAHRTAKPSEAPPFGERNLACPSLDPSSGLV